MFGLLDEIHIGKAGYRGLSKLREIDEAESMYAINIDILTSTNL